MVLTQKEATLIKDLKGQEKLCIDKYTKHAECAADPQLKQLFGRIAEVERGHLNTLTQIFTTKDNAGEIQPLAVIEFFFAGNMPSFVWNSLKLALALVVTVNVVGISRIITRMRRCL